MGLFQINAKDHQCEGNELGSEKNKKCLESPDKSLEFGIDSVKKKYNAMNSERSWTGGCSKWSELDSKEKTQCQKEKKTTKDCEREKRDKWRRAVAAYKWWGKDGLIDVFSPWKGILKIK